MDAKLTLKLDKEVIKDLKKYAKNQGTSVSRLLENYARKVIKKEVSTVEESIAPWLKEIREITDKYPEVTETDAELRADYDTYRDKKYGR